MAFLRDLSTFYAQFDERLLQLRVLPPVIAEMRSQVVAMAALPLVLAIMGRMRPEGFAARCGGDGGCWARACWGVRPCGCRKGLTRMCVCRPVCSGILPVLKPVFEQADGEVLLALVKHLAVFYKLMPRWAGGGGLRR